MSHHYDKNYYNKILTIQYYPSTLFDSWKSLTISTSISGCICRLTLLLLLLQYLRYSGTLIYSILMSSMIKVLHTMITVRNNFNRCGESNCGGPEIGNEVVMGRHHRLEHWWLVRGGGAANIYIKGGKWWVILILKAKLSTLMDERWLSFGWRVNLCYHMTKMYLSHLFRGYVSVSLWNKFASPSLSQVNYMSSCKLIFVI